MMVARDEEVVLHRTLVLAETRRLCTEWGYWCVYGMWGDVAGGKPALDTGGVERHYKTPPQWHPAEPKMPEANEISGLYVQKAFVVLPELYRRVLKAEFVVRPWIVPLREGEVEAFVARRARVSIGVYAITLDRSLLALANVMKRKGLWKECAKLTY